MENNRADSPKQNEGQAEFIGMPPALEMNPDDYLEDMAEFDLTDEQKAELLSTLWDICRRFVEMGVDVGAADPCGQIFDAAQALPEAGSKRVKSSFANATETHTDKKEDSPA